MWNAFKGNDRDLVVKGVFLMARIDHPEVLKAQVLNGDMHGTAPTGGIRVCEFKTVAFTFYHHKQIQLSAGMCCPEVGIAGFERSNDMLKGKALPRCA